MLKKKKPNEVYYFISDPRVAKFSKLLIKLEDDYVEFISQINDINYLIRCCFRDYDNLLYEFKHTESGFTQGKKKNIPLAKILKRYNKKIKGQIPLTAINYELAYAFDIFCFDVIRCVNFIVDFKSRLINNYSKKYANDIKKFYKDIQRRTPDMFDKNFMAHYNNWLKKFNDNRGELTHRRVSKELPSYWKFEIKPNDEETVSEKHEMIITMPNLGIDNLKDYLKNIFKNFNKFLVDTLKELNKN